MRNLRRILGSAALRPVLVIWGFGYLLVEIFAVLLGRSSPGTNLLSSIPLFAVGVGLTLLLDRTRLRLHDSSPLSRWLLMGMAIIAATAVHTAVDLHWLKWLALTVAPDWQEWALNLGRQRVFTVGLLYLWTFCLALTLLWAAGVSNAAQASAARASAFEASSHRAEAAALRLQLNPHFLFNAMNSVSSLVALDRKAEAEAMIGQLCDFLRASLASDPMADVALADEIDTIDAYLGIEAARFGDRLEVDIDVPDEAMGAQVPNFILQPLVENAIKHGVSAARGRATIRIGAAREGDMLVLRVVNQAEPGRAGDDSDERTMDRRGIGLSNIRQRLAIGYGDRARLETGAIPGGYSAVIRLPFVVGGTGDA